MKLIVFLKKTIIETLRDWKVLVMALIFGPLFVCIFYVAFNNKAVSYNILIHNSDISVLENNNEYNASKVLIEKFKSYKNQDNKPLYNISLTDDINKGQNDVKNRKYDVLILIPEDFSKGIILEKNNPQLTAVKFTMYGDLTYEKYIVPAIFLNSAVDEFINSETERVRPYTFEEVPLKSFENQTEFDMVLPTAIFLGIVMLIFTAAIAIIKEVDSGTIRRLQISKLKTYEFLLSVSIVQVIIGIISTILTLGFSIYIFGAGVRGTLLNIFIISIITCLPVIATGLIVAGISRNIIDILIIGNLPYFILLLFSGVFPIPRLNLFYLAGHSIALNDIFPTTPAVTALKKVVLEGSNLGDLGFELVLIGILTVIYVIIGMYLFNRKHMKLS